MTALRGPVLVVGAAGMLGRAVCERLSADGAAFRATDRGELDITDADATRSMLAGYPAVINCSAYTDVDGAESDETSALAINGTGVGNLARACGEHGGRLVHVSTDYVFDGAASEPYGVEHAIAPIGAYGRTKAAGEASVRESGCEHVIVRTSWLYAPWAGNFVRTMAALTRDRDTLKVVHDQRGTPTSAEHLASVLVGLASTGASGTYHATDGGECTWFELACAVRDGLGHECEVSPCATDEFPRPAPRPAYSVLDVSKTEEVVGSMPGWRANLAGVLDRLETY